VAAGEPYPQPHSQTATKKTCDYGAMQHFDIMSILMYIH
jgi:hypothetical protein